MKIRTPLLYGIVVSSLIITGTLFVLNFEYPEPTFNPDAQPGTGVMPREFVSSVLPGLEGNVRACFNHNGQIYVLSGNDLYEYSPAVFTLENIFPVEFKHGARAAFVYENKLHMLGTDGYLYPYDMTYFSAGILEPDGRVIKTNLKDATGLSSYGEYIYAIHSDGYLRKYYAPELFYGRTISRAEFNLGAEASYANSLNCFTLTDYIAFLMSGHRYHEYLVKPFAKLP
jgi:hypothetical protein